MFKILSVISMFCLLSACTSANYNMLNLNYKPQQQKLEKKAIKIALVKARYSVNQQMSQQLSQSLFSNMMPQRMMPTDYKVKEKYNNTYVFNLQNAMQISIENILLSKGFEVIKTLDSIDEVLYSDKKNIDLLLEPEFDFGPVVRNERTNIPLIGPIDKGMIQLTGKIKLIFSEPMSREMILLKSIDISSIGFNSSVEYSNAKDADNQLIELLNNMYPKLMGKIEKIVDPEVLIQSLADIKRLKKTM